MVQINVGGILFSTFLSTLRRHPDSRLAELFTDKPPKLRTDAWGRYFIDRDGTHFGAVLDYLRTDRVPTEHIKEVCSFSAGEERVSGRSISTHIRNFVELCGEAHKLGQ